MRDHVVRAHAYVLTAQNLQVALADPDDLALDTVQAVNRDVFDHVMGQLDRYVEVVTAIDVRSPTIRDPGRFISLLDQVAEHDEAAVRALAEHASPDCRVIELSSVDRRTWPALASTARCPASYENVRDYLEHYGEIDEHLAALLQSSTSISGLDTVPQASRVELAVRLLAATELDDVALRVRLVRSLDLDEPLTVHQVKPEEGLLLPLLLEHGLVEDTAELFDVAATLSWATRESMIAASSHFHDFMAPDHVTPADLPGLFRSGRVPARTKAAALTHLAVLARGASASAVTPAADHAIATSARLDAPTLLAVATTGVEGRKIVRLLQPVLQDLDVSELGAVLEALGPPYATLTRPSRRLVTIPGDPAHEDLLRYLKTFGVVSNWKEGRRADEVTVYLKHPR